MLEISNVSKEFNVTGNPLDLRVALDNVSIKVNEGDFITIIGGNGSGKSTLMNLIAGVHEQDSGTIKINSVETKGLKEHQLAKYLGRVFQDPSQGSAPDMSILENLEIALLRDEKKTLRWGFKKSNKSLITNLLKELNLGLESRLDTKVGLLSGGQRQALTLLMATIKKPKVLLLDEHTAALDPKTSRIVLELTEKLVSENNLTTVMITHNMKDAIKYGNRLIMLHGGKILAEFKDEEKKNLKSADLVKMFEDADEF